MKRNNRFTTAFCSNREEVLFPNEMPFTCQIKGLNLAQKSFLVYEAMGSKYLVYDNNWGDDLDIIRSTIFRKNHLVMLDAGCGPGWHLEQCAKLREFDHLIGIDYSPQMLKESHQRLANFITMNRIQLLQKNILNLRLPPASADVIVCFNNTLGNLLEADMIGASSARENGIAELKKVLRRGGYLIISVLNRDTFSQNNGYGTRVLRVDLERSNIEKGDFVVLYKTADGWECPYFSHWFNQNEVLNLLTKFGMEVIELLKRKKRLIVIARKK